MSNTLDILRNQYFEWLCKTVREDKKSEAISFRKLLMHLHTIEFRYLILRDQNRAEDGVDLRYRFAVTRNERNPEPIVDVLDGPCSVLEMMVALAVRCEENIMDDPSRGDRTGQWFWGMITNLGLGGMTDRVFDKKIVDEVITRLLDREYEPNGTGGLFTIRRCTRDLREVEIWYQLCWYLDSIS
jgi:hypothetical protein